MLFELTLTCLLGIIIWIILDNYFSQSNIPGPFKFPLLGNIPQILLNGKIGHFAFQKLAQKHGDVMRITVGLTDTIVLSSYEVAMEVCNMESLTGRFQNTFMACRTFGKPLGLFFSSGEFWRETKRFTFRNLREFGFGKSNTMESVISDQAEELARRLDESINSNKGVIKMDNTFGVPVLNVLWGMVAGETFSQDDKKLAYLLHVLEDIVKSGEFGGSISVAYPFLTDWFPKLTGKSEFKNNNIILQNFVEDLVKSRLNDAQNQYEPDCFVDILIAEMRKNKIFSNEHVISLLMDLFVAGGESSSTVLSFTILYTLLYPEVQRKIHAELDKVFPVGTRPNYDEREKVPYVQATLLEVFRHAIIVPFPPPRTSSKPVVYNGFKIGKDVPILVNIYSILHDKKTWGDADNFRPERFLDANGNLNEEMCKRVKNFGFGHRLCPGQRTAETTIFIFYTTFCQAFEIQQVPESTPAAYDINYAFTISPKPFNILLKNRRK